MDSALKKSTLKIISAHVLDVVKRYKTDETGATAIEYGLMSAFPLKADISECLIWGDFKPLDFIKFQIKNRTLSNKLRINRNKL